MWYLFIYLFSIVQTFEEVCGILVAVLKMGNINLEAKDSAHYHMGDISGISNIPVVHDGE